MMHPAMDEHRRAAGAYRKTQGLIKTTGKSPRPKADDAPAGKPPREAGDRSGRDTRSSGPPPRDTAPGDPQRRAGGPQLPPGKSLHEVAQFLTLIGRDQAAAVLRNMPREEADRIVDTMAHLDPISPGEARRILVQFGARRNAVDHEVAGGPETAREILVRAFGQEDGDRRFYELLPEEPFSGVRRRPRLRSLPPTPPRRRLRASCRRCRWSCVPRWCDGWRR